MRGVNDEGRRRTTDIPNFMGMNGPSDTYKDHDSNQHLNCTYKFDVTEHRGKDPSHKPQWQQNAIWNPLDVLQFKVDAGYDSTNREHSQSVCGNNINRWIKHQNQQCNCHADTRHSANQPEQWPCHDIQNNKITQKPDGIQERLPPFITIASKSVNPIIQLPLGYYWETIRCSKIVKADSLDNRHHADPE